MSKPKEPPMEPLPLKPLAERELLEVEQRLTRKRICGELVIPANAFMGPQKRVFGTMVSPVLSEDRLNEIRKAAGEGDLDAVAELRKLHGHDD